MANPHEPAPLDQYSALDYHPSLAGRTTGQTIAPGWLPDTALRRINAYRILSLYLNNSARRSLTAGDAETRNEHREYGDPRLLVDRIVSGILGAGAQITVAGSQQPPLSAPTLPARPEPYEGDDPIEARISSIRLDVWNERATAIVDEWAAAHDAYPALAEQQSWLESWWALEQLDSKIYELEANGAVPLGDGVAVLGWSTLKNRPTVTIYEPDAYQPVLSDEPDDFPDKVHLAWEYETEAGDRYVRRITYELVDTEPYRVPWSTEPATQTCLLTDKEWRLNTGRRSWEDLDAEAALVGVNEDGEPLDGFDLGVDFLPVVHVPNTPASQEHFGRSSITPVAQLFDDIAQTDTDIQRAAAFAGGPVVGASGVNVQTLQVRPGTVIPTGDGGRLDVLDMSKGLTAVLSLLDEELDRLSINSQVPGVVMGRVSGDDVPSGVALSLSFAPFEQLVGILRLTRFPTYKLIPKMAMRLQQVNAPGGPISDGPTPPFDLTFASTIPTDINAAVQNIAALLNAHGVSTATAVRALEEAGIPVDDLEAEVARIRAENTGAAKEIADATGSEKAAADVLGIELEAAGAPDPATSIDIPEPDPADALPGPL